MTVREFMLKVEAGNAEAVNMLGRMANIEVYQLPFVKTRTVNALLNMDIKRLDQLVVALRKDFEDRALGIGEKTMQREIIPVLETVGLSVDVKNNPSYSIDELREFVVNGKDKYYE